MKKAFSIIYDRLLIVKEAGKLCKDFWKPIQELKDSFDEDLFWSLLTQNIEWLLNASGQYNLGFDILTAKELKEWFSQGELKSYNIYITGEVKVFNSFAIGLGDASIEATGHSRVLLFENASADCFDTSFVSGYDQSSFIVNDCIGNAYHECKSQAKGLSIIESWSSVTPIGNNQSVIVDRL